MTNDLKVSTKRRKLTKDKIGYYKFEEKFVWYFTLDASTNSRYKGLEFWREFFLVKLFSVKSLYYFLT